MFKGKGMGLGKGRVFKGKVEGKEERSNGWMDRKDNDNKSEKSRT